MGQRSELLEDNKKNQQADNRRQEDYKPTKQIYQENHIMRYVSGPYELLVDFGVTFLSQNPNNSSILSLCESLMYDHLRFTLGIIFAELKPP